MNTQISQKTEQLKSVLKKFSSLTVAFSGGVDSSLVLAIASQVLKENVIAVTSDSLIHPKREKESANLFAKKLGIKHFIIKTNEMQNPEFVSNNSNRCYVCKKELFSKIKKIASDYGITNIAHGANIDDLKDFRPGFVAAHEMGIYAPLIQANLTKQDIRMILKDMGLLIWNKPSMACLVSRIPYKAKITKQKLNMVDQAENFLIDIGFNICRVRHYGETARIEVAAQEFKNITDEKIRVDIVKNFREIGFLYVGLDLEGYIEGSMNRSLTDKN